MWKLKFHGAFDASHATPSLVSTQSPTASRGARAFSKYCGAEDAKSRIHYYEDLVDGAPQASAEWALVLKQLGTSPISTTTSANYTIIRGKRPPLESVANPDEVRRALANSRHAWMLEERDLFDRLKSTHAHSPPPRYP